MDKKKESDATFLKKFGSTFPCVILSKLTRSDLFKVEEQFLYLLIIKHYLYV